VISPSTDIYEYIPQESDLVIEINTRNFVSEFAYQRIFNEEYVVEKVHLEDQEINTGIDYFSKVILFREQWAEENVWIGVVGYTDKSNFKQYMESLLDKPKIEFGDDHAIIQLTKSKNQALLDEHITKISKKEIKPFTARVDLNQYFSSEKEVNCYIIPTSSGVDNQLIDGHINFDFMGDYIDIGGNFTTVSSFGETPSIAYALNEDIAFSLRSSLNVFNSIYWFSKEKIDNVPDYDQMALDYDGVNMFMVDRNWGYDFPFKTFPEMQLHFDINQSSNWQAFFDSLNSQELIRVDTLTNSLITQQGAFFKYNVTDEIFEIMHKEVNLTPAEDSGLCFDFQMKIAPLLDNTKFAVDEDNPPSVLEQTIGMSVAEEMIDELHVLDNIEQIKFQLIRGEDSNMNASGHVQMKNREGQSMIELMYFMTEALLFVSEY
jgi:hypothetical protein